MNLMDLIPVDWIPMGAMAVGIPYMKVVPTTDVNITFGMSIAVFFLIIIYTTMFKGPLGLRNFGLLLKHLYCRTIIHPTTISLHG